jgi:hypothetical protein
MARLNCSVSLRSEAECHPLASGEIGTVRHTVARAVPIQLRCQLGIAPPICSWSVLSRPNPHSAFSRCASPDAQARFRREQRLSAAVDHQALTPTDRRSVPPPHLPQCVIPKRCAARQQTMLLMDRRTITHLKENQAALEHKTSRSESSVADTRAWWPRWKTPRTRDRRYETSLDRLWHPELTDAVEKGLEKACEP